MHNHPTILKPSREIEKKSLEESLLLLSLRALWHRLFDNAPTVLALDPTGGKDFLERFLEFADNKNYSMDWSLHVQFLIWLENQKNLEGKIVDSHIKELVSSSTLKWAVDLYENMSKTSIVIWVPKLNCAIGTMRYKEVLTGPRTVMLKMKAPQKSMNESYCYYLGESENWDKPENWELIYH